MTPARTLAEAVRRPGETVLAAVPDGMTGKAIVDLAAAAHLKRVVFVARDGQRLAEIERGLSFFAPKIEVLEFPAWDCLPYDRVSPHPAVVARRMAALARLGRERPSAADRADHGQRRCSSACRCALPSRGGSLSAAAGDDMPMADLDPLAGGQRLPAHRDRSRARRIRRARRHPRSLRRRRDGAAAARFLRRHAGIDPRLRHRQPAHDRGAKRIDLVAGERDGADRGEHRAFPPGLCRRVRRRRSATTCSTTRSAKAAATSAWSIGCRCSPASWRRCSTHLPRCASRPRSPGRRGA